MNELQVRLSADIKQLQTALSRAKKTIKDFETETENGSERSNVGFRRKIGLIEQLENKAKKLRVALRQATNEDQVERYNKELNQTVAEMTRLNALGRQVGGSISQTGAAFKKTGGSIVNTNGVALEFNRIIQDAPFAMNNFGSVANNMQQGLGNLTAQFQKGVPASVVWKSLLQSMVSPMNLVLLGVSALTAGFTAYQMGAFDFLKSNKDAAKELEKFNEELENFRKTLDGVASARVKGSADATKEIAELNALQKQAQNINTEMDVRISAVNQLQQKKPEYFGNLSEEAILTGDVGDANERLTTQLLGRAKAQAALNEIGERSLDILTIEERVQQRILDILNLQNRAEALKIKLSQQRAAGVAGPGAAAGQGIVRQIANIEEEITELGKEQIKDVEFLNKLKSKTASQEEFINGLLGEGVKLNEDQAKAVKETADSFNALDEEIAKVASQNELAAEATSKLVDLYKNLNDEIRKSNGIIDFKSVDFEVDFDPSQYDKLTEAQKKVIDDAIRAKKLAEEFQKDMTKVGSQLSNVFAEAFERGIFEGENFFDSIAQGFKRLLAQLASQLAAAAFLNILASLTTGGVSTFFGAAAKANPFGSIFGREHGGPVSAGQPYIVGEKRPEIFVPSTSGRIIPRVPSSPMVSASGASAGVMQKIDVNVYGEIMNDRIVLSEARGKRAIGRFYGING